MKWRRDSDPLRVFGPHGDFQAGICPVVSCAAGVYFCPCHFARQEEGKNRRLRKPFFFRLPMLIQRGFRSVDRGEEAPKWARGAYTKKNLNKKQDFSCCFLLIFNFKFAFPNQVIRKKEAFVRFMV